MSLYPIISPFGSVAAITFNHSEVKTADASAYTFSAVTLGTGKIVVGVMNQSATTARTVSSLTVDGNAAAQVVSQLSSNGNEVRTDLWQYNGNAGASGEIVVTLSGAANRCGIGVWLVENAADAANDTGASTADPLNDTLNIPKDGAAIGYAAHNGGGTFGWTNLTEKFDETVESNSIHSGASDAFSTVQAALSITADPSISNPASRAFVAASWDHS